MEREDMNWQSISWNLVDARGEMSHMLARVQCAAFGKVCDADSVRQPRNLLKNVTFC